MKLIKRKLAKPIMTSFVWSIPTITYIILKIYKIVDFNTEWIWWVTLPTLLSSWVTLNFEIKIEQK